MFNLENVKLTDEEVTASGIFILVSIADNRIFHDGKVTDEVDGVKVTVATLPNFDRVVVKIPGAGKDISKFSDDEIKSKNSSGEFVKVKFKGFSSKIWQNYKSKEIQISATADDVEVVSNDNPIDFGN